MSNPAMADEPNVQIRGPRASTSYGGITEPPTGILIADVSAPGPSINSTNGDAPLNGAPPTGRRKLDKTPLLTSDQLARSNSMMSSNGMQQNAGMQTVMRTDGLSTFSGVLAPVALSMFSVLLFLRMGFVVGQSGVLITIVQLTMAYCIVFLTVFSLCAISTNGAIEGGGVYYMISRALGPEFGGSIGVLFFLANIFSCSLQVAGFVEVLLNNFGNGGSMLSGPNGLPTDAAFKFIYGVVVLFVLLLACLVGARLFAKTSLVVLFVVAACYATFLVSIIFKGFQEIPIPKTNVDMYQLPKVENETTVNYNFSQTKTANYTGFSFNTLGENFLANYTHDYTTEKELTFPIVFAIIFSGITGIMAGANMSGELKQPDVSIPRGTLQAVLMTYVVYVLTTLLLGATCSRYLLHNDYTVLLDINIWPPFILIAIFATTLFSSMSNLIGASRVLSRVGEDRLFGFLLKPATVYFGDRNPVFSVVIGWILAVLVLLIGALNRIAQITSILFLLSYMGVNLACLGLEMASAPNFRPTFKFFSWHTAALGCTGCVAMMLLIDAATSAIAIILLMLLLIILHYQAPIGSWGSISQALIYHQVRKYLLLLDSRKDHVKYWRPQILLLVKRPATSCPLMNFVNDLKKSGLYVIGHVKQGRMDDYEIDPLHDVYPYWLSLIDYLKIKSFVELTVNSSVRLGIEQLTRLSGLGAMKPNTVIMGFHDAALPNNTLHESRLLKDLKFAKIDRAEVVEYFTAKDYMPQEMNDGGERLSTVEYVHIVHDLLKLHKNIAIARHFHRLDKEALIRNSAGNNRKYVDVWPVDMLKPGETGWGWDNSCLFLLQLACILSMSSKWKSHTTLRVFLCVTSLQDMHRRERQLKQMLDQLRIFAKSLVVPWDHVICHLGTPEDAARADRDAAELPEAYLKAMNEMIKKNSAETAIVFLNMPVPPPEEHKYEKYIANLEKLTDDLPPTLLVHGLASVISTAL